MARATSRARGLMAPSSSSATETRSPSATSRTERSPRPSGASSGARRPGSGASGPTRAGQVSTATGVWLRRWRYPRLVPVQCRSARRRVPRPPAETVGSHSTPERSRPPSRSSAPLTARSRSCRCAAGSRWSQSQPPQTPARGHAGEMRSAAGRSTSSSRPRCTLPSTPGTTRTRSPGERAGDEQRPPVPGGDALPFRGEAIHLDHDRCLLTSDPVGGRLGRGRRARARRPDAGTPDHPGGSRAGCPAPRERAPNGQEGHLSIPRE